MTVSVSQAKGKDIFKSLESESYKPPLYFLLMRSWLTKNDSEFWIRLPSAICGALTCLLALTLGNQLFGINRGWVLAVILALAPFHVYYSQEARMYALLGLTGAGAMLFTWLFCRTQRWRDAGLYLVCATLSCYIFTYGIFLLPFSCLLAVFFQPRLSRKAIAIIWGTNILAALLFCPWIPFLMESVKSGTGLQMLSRGPVILALAYSVFTLGFGITFGPTTEQLRVLGKRIFAENPIAGGLLVGGLMLVVIVILIGLRFLWQRNRNGFFFSLIGLGIFCGCPALLNVLKPGIPYNARYAILALIPLSVTVAGFLFWAMERGLWRKALALLFIGGIGTSLANHFFNPKYARDDMRSAARFIQSLEPTPRHLIVCADFMQMSLHYYYDGSANLFPVKIRAGNIEELFKPFESELVEGETFGLVYSRPDHGDPQGILPAWLSQRYTLISQKTWTGVTFYLYGARKPLAGTFGFQERNRNIRQLNL
ncbi:MAG: glycosyltransferase family 39 protein [Verrucomicrobiota bacterium]